MSRTLFIFLTLTAIVWCDNLPWPQRGHDTRLTRHVNNETINLLGSNPFILNNFLFPLSSVFASSEIIVDDANFYFYSSSYLYSYFVSNNTYSWFSLPPDNGTTTSFTALPCIIGDNLYITATTWNGSLILSYNKINGILNWSKYINGTSISPPAALPQNNDILITSYYVTNPTLSAGDFVVIGLNVSDQEIVWRYVSLDSEIAVPIFENRGGAIGPEGIVHQMYTAVINETNLRLLVSINGVSGHVVQWSIAQENVDVDAEIVGVLGDGTILFWNGAETQFLNSSHNLVRQCNGKISAIVGTQYLAGNEGVEKGLSYYSENGTLLWTMNPGGLVTGTSVLGNNYVYVSATAYRSAQAYAIDLLSGEIVWEMGITTQNQLPTLSVPTIASDGTLFIIVENQVRRVGCCSGNGNCSLTGCSCFENWRTADCSVFCQDSQCGANSACNAMGNCVCKDNFYPVSKCNVFCTREKTCSNHGNCGSDGMCTCETTLWGTWQNSNCDSLQLSFTSIILIVVGSLCVVTATVIFVQKLRERSARGRYYPIQ